MFRVYPVLGLWGFGQVEGTAIISTNNGGGRRAGGEIGLLRKILWKGRRGINKQLITTTNQTTRKHIILCPLTGPVAILTGNLWPSSIPSHTLLLSTSHNYSSRFPLNSFFGPFTVLQIKVQHETNRNKYFFLLWNVFWAKWYYFSVCWKSADLGDHRKEICVSRTGEGGLAAQNIHPHI